MSKGYFIWIVKTKKKLFLFLIFGSKLGQIGSNVTKWVQIGQMSQNGFKWLQKAQMGQIQIFHEIKNVDQRFHERFEMFIFELSK